MQIKISIKSLFRGQPEKEKLKKIRGHLSLGSQLNSKSHLVSFHAPYPLSSPRRHGHGFGPLIRWNQCAGGGAELQDHLHHFFDKVIARQVIRLQRISHQGQRSPREMTALSLPKS